MDVIREDMRACGINESIVRDRERWRENIQVAHPTYMG